ncbi:unnamed protein product [Withania somnifera]
MANTHSDDDEESGEAMEVSSPENADTESEPESEPAQIPKKPPVAPPKKPQPQDSSSSTEEESDSESEPEPEPDPKTRKPNPVAKPIEKPKKPSPKPRSKSDATTKLTSPKKSSSVDVAGAKRPLSADEGEAKESKKSKKKQVKEIDTPVKKTATEDVKRQLFQRLWSEDDEIAILKGMIDYRSKKKADPVADLGAFHEFIKKSLHVDVAKTQLQDKIRRLKKKYVNNAGKEKKGKERIFSKPHELKAYEISKKIWGSKEKSDNKGEVEVVKVENVGVSKGKGDSGGEDNGVLVEVKEEKQSMDVEKNVEVTPNLSLVSCGESVAALEKWLEENSGLLSVEKRNEIEKKSMSLKVAEVDLYSRRIKLIDEQAGLVHEAMRAAGIEI